MSLHKSAIASWMVAEVMQIARYHRARALEGSALAVSLSMKPVHLIGIMMLNQVILRQPVMPLRVSVENMDLR